MTRILAAFGLFSFGALCAGAGYALAGLQRIPEMTTEEVLRRLDNNVVPLTPRERIMLRRDFAELLKPENAGA